MAGEPFRLCGSNYSRDRLKVRTIVLVYSFKGPSSPAEEPAWAAIDAFQPAAPLGLTEVGRSAAQEENGDFKLSITFEGVLEEDAALGALLEYDNSSVDSPIESFERFDALEAVYGPAIYSDAKKTQFQGWPKKINESDGTGNQIKNPLWGTSHFLETNTVLRVTFVTKNFRPALLRNLCKIQTPSVPAGQETNIQTADGHTWLYKSYKAKFRGNCWENEQEYWEGKWAPDIYNPQS